MEAGPKGGDPGDTIFVVLPTHCDPLSSRTVHTIFSRAARPELVRVGVCEVRHPSDEGCVRGYLTLARDMDEPLFERNIRVLRASPARTPGPMASRRAAFDTFYGGERYVLCIDGHTNLVPNWDIRAIAMLKACNPRLFTSLQKRRHNHDCILTSPLADTENYGTEVFEEGVMSVYPFLDRFQKIEEEEVQQGGQVQQGQTRKGKKKKRTKTKQKNKKRRGMPMWGAAPFLHPPHVPVPALAWSSRFSFSRADVFRKVPFDERVPGLSSNVSSSRRPTGTGRATSRRAPRTRARTGCARARRRNKRCR